MCPPAFIFGFLSAGLGFMQNRAMVAAQNEAIEVQNINQAAQFDRDKIQVAANRFREQQQFQSTELANETRQREGEIEELDISDSDEEQHTDSNDTESSDEENNSDNE